MASSTITSWQVGREKVEAVIDFLFVGSKITADGDCSHEIRRQLLLGRKAMKNLGSLLNRKDVTLPAKVHIVKAVVFPVVMYRCESWALKNWCFQTAVLEKTLESPLATKEIKPGNPKGNQHWIFYGRTEAEAPILWEPDVKSQLIEKNPDPGKD